MDIPSKIYLDRRVAANLPAEPSHELCADSCYLSQAYVEELLRDVRQETISMIPSETVVQLSTSQIGDSENEPLVVALTNLGRIFEQVVPGTWVEVPGPEFSTEESGAT